MPRQKKLQEYTQPAGSPKSGEPLFLVVGRLLKPHGLHGEIMMELDTDFPERLKPGGVILVGESHMPTTIRSRRVHKNGLLLGFDKIHSPEEAGRLRNEIVYVNAEDLPPLAIGEYYHHQVLGLRVITDTGQELGTLAGILGTGANDVYIVRSASGKESLIPNIESVVKEIDLEKGEMLIHLLDGLLAD
jgi:16S rRNA processing protein RimM